MIVVKRLTILLRNPRFWGIIVMFSICVMLHYPNHMLFPKAEILNTFLGLQRHAIVRILFLAPITYATFVFGMRGGIISITAAFAAMLPRILLISPYPRDAVFEMSITIAMGSLISWSLEFRRREIGRRDQVLLKLEAVRRELQTHIQVIKESERRISAVHSVSTAVNQSLALEQVLDVAADRIQEGMHIDFVFIFLLDEEAGRLDLRAYRGASEEFASGVTGLEIGEGFNGWVAQTGESCFVEDVAKDSRLSREAVKKAGVKSVFIVPLRSKDKVIGTLCVATRTLKQFASEEKELLALIGTELGVAAEKASLFQELQRIGERFQEIFEKAHDAIWIQDLSGEITAANQAASELAGYKLEELIGRDVSQFLTPQGLKLAREVEQNLLSLREVKQPYEQIIVKRDGTEAILMLTTSLLGDEKTRAFLHIARDITDERKLQENLRLYVNQISKAHEEERRRIARELHDDTIQTMVAISRRLDNFVSKNPVQEPTLRPLEKIQRDIDEALIRIRRFIQDLRPPTLEYLGLIPALRELAVQVQEQSGITASLEVLGLERHFTPEEGLLIYRIVQEAVRNVWRHSGATQTKIDMKFDERETIITISDNGSGFEIQVNPRLLELGKLGLMGMKERAHLLGGNLNITSKRNSGTTVTLSIPVKQV